MWIRSTKGGASACLQGCSAACMERAMGALRAKAEDLRPWAEAIGAAVERSQNFWRAMLDGLPEGCRAPLSPTCRWRRRAHCRHQGGRLCLSEPPWQLKSANAAVAAPCRARTSRSASSASAASPRAGRLLGFAEVSAAASRRLPQLLLLSPRRFAASFA